MRAKAILLLTTLAFVASLFVVAAFAPPRKARSAIDAARLATMQVAKPDVRKADGARAPGHDAMTPRVFAVSPARLVRVVPAVRPITWSAPALRRSLSMVFLN